MPNPNIIIQSIKDDTITLSIDGEVQVIQNQLAELKALLQSQKVQNIQHAEKIYNIEHINEANFGFVTGKKLFNAHLTKSLIEAIHTDILGARKFLKNVKNMPNWESETRLSDLAKQIINDSFVGVIGVELSKLMAIGKEDLSESKQRKYIDKCLHIAKLSIDLLCFALLSRFWDIQKQKYLPLTGGQHETLSYFFENTFGLSFEEKVHLLKTLIDIYDERSLELPFSELKGFGTELHEGKEFFEVCRKLQLLNQNLDKVQFSLLDCFEAETCLTTFLTHLRFFVNYNMASIKKIGYQEIRNADPHYVHRYTALGVDGKANYNAEKINYTPQTVHTDAVLIYKGEDYSDNIDLFPFAIDYNALTFENGAKICFYRSRNFSDDSLEYFFHIDNSVNFIEYKAILGSKPEYNELLKDKDNRKIMNLDMVVTQFEDARKCILGNETSLDFGDIFDKANNEISNQ